MQSSSFLIIPNVSQKSLALKLVKLGVITFVISVIVGVYASAYTTTQDGLSTVYTWGWSEDSLIAVPYSDRESTLYIRATYGSNTVYYNPPFVSGATRLNNFTQATGLNNIIQYDAGYMTTMINAGGWEVYDYAPPKAIKFILSSENVPSDLNLNQAFSVTFSYYSYFQSITTSGTWNTEYITLLNNTPLIIDVADGQDYSLYPTVTTLNDIYVTENDSVIKLVELTFIVDLDLANTDIHISGFTLNMYGGIDSPSFSVSSDYPVPFYSRYNMSFSDVEFRTIPSEEAQEALLIANVSNDDLISKLGVINEIDQGKINYQKFEYNKVSSATGQLSGMTDFSESLSSQVDLSQRVDVLTEGTLVDGVSNMWDIFPWESDFFTLAIAMISSISLLSLILHGGERALFSAKGKSSSNKNNRGDDG